MGRRASTNCCSPPSAAPRTAFPCISAWPGIGRCTRTSCAAPATRFSCPAAARRARAIASSRRRSPARCARSPSAARTPSITGRSQPTWRRRCERAAACRRKRISPTDARAPSSSSRSHIDWRGLDVWQCPPNGPGLVALMILGELEALGDAPDGPAGVTRFHRHIEAARMAYRDRDAFLADPRQRETPVRPPARARLSRRAGAAHRRQALASRLARSRRNRARGAAATRSPFRSSTATAAPAVSSTRSTRLSAAASSPKRSGVLLQNRGLCFTFEPGHPNSFAPNTRPAHTIMPGMATRDGRARDLLRRDGRALSADGPELASDQRAGIWHGHSTGARFSPNLPASGRSRDRTRRFAGDAREADRARPRADRSRAASRRRTGDHDRPRARSPRSAAQTRARTARRSGIRLRAPQPITSCRRRRSH